MNSMPTSPAGSSSRNPPALRRSVVPSPWYQGCRGSHCASSSSLVGVIVVWWIMAIRELLGGRRRGEDKVTAGRRRDDCHGTTGKGPTVYSAEPLVVATFEGRGSA